MSWFITYTGKKIFPLAIKPDDLDIQDIAHALANTCRFGGHCATFYSVAQHSVLVSDQLPTDLRKVGLLHDATEAYLGDMIRPLKYQMDEYRVAEDRLWKVIAERFELPSTIPMEVKHVDNRLLMTEKRDLLTSHDHAWEMEHSHPPYSTLTISPDNPYWAERSFLEHWMALHGWDPETAGMPVPKEVPV